jgi:filamentous hemagglutinin family protein
MNQAKSKSSFRLKMAVIAIAACFAPLAQANPIGPVVLSGAARIVNSGNTMTVTNTPGAILNWQQFNINQGQTTQFNQQSASSSVLNRVTGTDSSQILGALRSNGQVYLINPNGIMFGAGSVVDVNRLIASTLNITDADFLANNLKFNGNSTTSVVNQGQISTPVGGSVYLIGNDVINHGVITTPEGSVVLAAGKRVSLVNSVTPHVSVTLSAGAQALNLGKVSAGSINIFGALVRQQGVLNADSASVNAQGQIVFTASQSVELAAGSATSANGAGNGGTIFMDSGISGTTIVSGTVSATGAAGNGGAVTILGNHVGLLSGATVDVSGGKNGGTALIGGNFQGKGPPASARTAHRTLATVAMSSSGPIK